MNSQENSKLKNSIIEYISLPNIKNINNGAKKNIKIYQNINDNDLLGLLIERMITHITILYNSKIEITKEKLYEIITGTNIFDKIYMLLEFYEENNESKDKIKNFVEIIKSKINKNEKIIENKKLNEKNQKYNFYYKKLSDNIRSKRIKEIKNIINSENSTGTSGENSKKISKNSTGTSGENSKKISKNSTGTSENGTRTRTSENSTGTSGENSKKTNKNSKKTSKNGTRTSENSTGTTIEDDKIYISNYFYNNLVLADSYDKKIYHNLTKKYHTNKGGKKESFQYLNNINTFLQNKDNFNGLKSSPELLKYLHKDDTDISYFIDYFTNIKPITFPNKLIKSLDNYLSKKKILSLKGNEFPKLLKEYNLIVKENNIDKNKLDKIKNKIINKINKHKNNTKYKNIGGIDKLLNYMEIRKFKNIYILNNVEIDKSPIIDKSTIIEYLPEFKDNNKIKNNNLSNI